MDYCASLGGRLPGVAELKALRAKECQDSAAEECRFNYWSSAEY